MAFFDTIYAQPLVFNTMLNKVAVLFALTLSLSPVFSHGDDQGESESLSSKASSLWEKAKESTIKGAEIVAETTADTWDATKDATQKGVDATTETSKKVWEKTKEKSADVADSASNTAESGWSKTKEVSEKSWDVTKSTTKKVLDFGSGALKKAGDAISSDSDSQEAIVVDKTGD